MSAVPYILVFCRVVIGLVFLISSFSKVGNFSRFRQTIISFRLIGTRLSGITALLFLCCEFAITGLVTFGGSLLLPGFLLALILLLIFSSALGSILIRRIQTNCNCFGSSARPISIVDLWRNLGFALCAFGGCIMLTWMPRLPEHLGAIEWLLMGICAGIFVLLWTRLGEITRLIANV